MASNFPDIRYTTYTHTDTDTHTHTYTHTHTRTRTHTHYTPNCPHKYTHRQNTHNIQTHKHRVIATQSLMTGNKILLHVKFITSDAEHIFMKNQTYSIYWSMYIQFTNNYLHASQNTIVYQILKMTHYIYQVHR